MQVSGTIATQRVKETAARIAQGVPGVSIVTNELVLGPGVTSRGDAGDPATRLYLGSGAASRSSREMRDRVQGAFTEPNGDEER